MDEVEQRKAVAALVRQAMPRVARLVAEKRAELGAEYVVECQKRGMAGEPGWFFAREGPLAVGTPWPEIVDLVSWAEIPQKAILCLRSKEVR